MTADPKTVSASGTLPPAGLGYPKQTTESFHDCHGFSINTNVWGFLSHYAQILLIISDSRL